MERAKLILVTGGARSGKSARAITAAMKYPIGRRYFIATGEARDDEMTRRIARHRDDRDADFITIEEPVEVAAALQAIEHRADIVVLDCLTLWVANLMDRAIDDDHIATLVQDLVVAVARSRFDTIIVSGEVGSGIVPDNALARRYRDLLGWTNQRVARAADGVVMMVAGYPLTLK